MNVSETMTLPLEILEIGTQTMSQDTLPNRAPRSIPIVRCCSQSCIRSSPDILYIPRPGTKPSQIIHIICRILNTQMVRDGLVTLETRSPFEIHKRALAPNMRGGLLRPRPIHICAPDGFLVEPTWWVNGDTISGEVYVNSVHAQESEELDA